MRTAEQLAYPHVVLRRGDMRGLVSGDSRQDSSAHWNILEMEQTHQHTSERGKISPKCPDL